MADTSQGRGILDAAADRATVIEPIGRRRSSYARAWLIVPILALVAACGSPGSLIQGTSGPAGATSTISAANSGVPASGTITLYTTVQQPVVDAVIAAFRITQPGIAVEVLRAPTGELSARIATELRDGQVQGDVLWLSDPLSMQSWRAQDVLQAWTPVNAAVFDPAEATDSFWATRILNIVIVTGTDVNPGPADWADLGDAAYEDGIALPDPAFAGSAFAALGYFALEPDYGLDYYRRLKANGAVQLKSPDEVVSAVAEGRFKAGITLDSSARAAVTKGSPVTMVWPPSGAISVYGPVAVVSGAKNLTAAEAFVEFLLSRAGQAVLGEAGQEPVLGDSGGPRPGGPQVRPDWSAVFGRQEQLLEEYQAIFGG
ncbi:MAG: extracellular solute-binding protein [Chloroflexi bacterium]|nr:extracellular solute-binding protein [Chloroflexota bacterium]